MPKDLLTVARKGQEGKIMQYPEKIDLHMHTTASDGTDSPEEIIQNVRKAGIGLFAVTDHDGVKGALEVERRLSEDPENDLLFLKGIEFSCRDEDGKYHILGYQYDSSNQNFLEAIHAAHTNRLKKLEGRIAFLKEEFGFTFTEEEISGLKELENPGKPHLANLMIKHGYADSIPDAMKEFLNKKKFPNVYIRPETAIQIILESGGVPVLAHPFYGDGSQLILGEEMKARLEKLIGFGLQGVESFYSGFTVKLTKQMLEMAERYDLYVTAGSDYHGTNKMVPLGDTNLPSVTGAPVQLKRFLMKMFPDLTIPV